MNAKDYKTIISKVGEINANFFYNIQNQNLLVFKKVKIMVSIFRWIKMKEKYFKDQSQNLLIYKKKKFLY